MTLERIGPYRIVRLLGKGGMGAVYEAIHEAIERRVAIKVLHAELGRRQDLATRFFNEARAVNRIEHPGLVQISDYGQLPDGMAYIVMEYLKGETLGQRLKRASGKMGAAEVIRLGRQICTAIAAAHEKDIVHRDLKPDNIMIVPNADVPGGEQVKILDFGIAKLAESESGAGEVHTRADALLGTPKYMSPEQCKGSGGVDAKSDVYSLGVIFYELLAGQPPFLGSAHGELIVQHIVHEPPPLATLADQTTPEVLTRLIHLMMSKDKTARPTMRQVVAELDRLGGLLSGVYGTVPMGAGISGPGIGPITPTPPPGWLPGAGSLPGAVSQPSLPSLPGGGAARSYHSMTPVPGAASPASTLAMSAGQVPVTQPRRFPLSIAIGGLAGAIAVGVVLILSFGKAPPPQPLPPKPAVQQPPRPTPQQPDSPKTVHWSVTTTPQGAKVIRQRDGEVLGTTPLVLDLPRASGGEPVRLVLPGYAEMSLSLDLDKDSDLQIELHRKGGRERRTKDPGSSSKTHGKGYVPGDLTVVD